MAVARNRTKQICRRLPVCALPRNAQNSPKKPRFPEQFSEFGLGFDWTIQCRLKFHPTGGRKDKADSISQGQIRRHDASVEQEFADIFV